MRKGLATLGYIALFILGLTLLLFPLALRGQDYGKSALTAHNIVINEQASCSATAVGPHVLFMVAHCLDMHNEIEIDPKDGNPGKVEIVAIELDNYDHALLYLSGIEFTEYAGFADALPVIGDEIYIVGNPMDLRGLLRKGYVSGSKDDGHTILVDLNGFFGDSGAAVFNKKGQIISAASVLVTREANGQQFKLMGYYPNNFTAEQLKKAREWKQ